jgi:hypothetical protein
VTKKKQDSETTVTAIKGFDQNWTCREYKFEIGKTYEHDGNVAACQSGFHACEFAFDVFGYYPPGTSRYAIVTQSGDIARHDQDSKIASAKITIEAEIHLPELIKRGVDWILAKVDFDNEPATNTGYRSAATNTGDQSAATNTGDRSAATNTGYQSAATNTGDRSAATNTGYRSAATNTGDQSAATNTGYRSAATNTGDRSAATNTGDQSAATNTGDRSAAEASGKDSVALASGYQGRARGTDGCALFLVHRNDEHKITQAWAGIVGRDGIKPMVWYWLDESGKPVEADHA